MTEKTKKNGAVGSALALLPEKLRYPLLEAANSFGGNINEIRLYRDRPVVFVTDRGVRFPDLTGGIKSFPGKNCVSVSRDVFGTIISSAAGGSVYQYEKELCAGYITAQSGIRIGVCFSEPDKMFSSERITSLNIRLPYPYADVPGLPLIKDHIAEGGMVIAGPPCSGKTTLLKACCRELCRLDGGAFRRVSVIDTRGELEAFSFGSPGYAADIISCFSRAEGIQRALRLMSPEYIICDEAGDCDETAGILEGMNGGVRFIAAMHAGSIGELVKRKQFRMLFEENVFYRAVMLSGISPGEILAVYGRKELEDEIRKSCDHLCGYRGGGA